MYAITLAAAAILWPFVVAFVANGYGADVSARFLERLAYIPSNGKPLTVEALEEWLRSPTTGPFRKPYAFLVMPLDLVYICFAGGFLVCGALWLTTAIAWPQPAKPLFCLLVCILPAVYVISDLVEDALIMRILSRHDVNPKEFGAMRWATKIKMLSFGAAAVQIVVLGLYAIRWGEA